MGALIIALVILEVQNLDMVLDYQSNIKHESSKLFGSLQLIFNQI